MVTEERLQQFGDDLLRRIQSVDVATQDLLVRAAVAELKRSTWTIPRNRFFASAAAVLGTAVGVVLVSGIVSYTAASALLATQGVQQQMRKIGQAATVANHQLQMAAMIKDLTFMTERLHQNMIEFGANVGGDPSLPDTLETSARHWSNNLGPLEPKLNAMITEAAGWPLTPTPAPTAAPPLVTPAASSSP